MIQPKRSPTKKNGGVGQPTCNQKMYLKGLNQKHLLILSSGRLKLSKFIACSNN